MFRRGCLTSRIRGRVYRSLPVLSFECGAFAMQNRLVALFVVVGVGAAISLLLRADELTPSATFPTPTNSEPDSAVKALPPDEAARGFRVPDGFQVSVFAADRRCRI